MDTGEPGSSGRWSRMLQPRFRGAAVERRAHRTRPADPCSSINDRGIVGRVHPASRLHERWSKLWISKAIDVENGSLFDIVERGPKGKLKAEAAHACPSCNCCATCRRSLCRADAARRSTGPRRAAIPSSAAPTRRRSPHHYDISNDFYRLFLDERMVYSCGYFTDFTNGIDQAQADKLDHICRKLRLKPGERLLDIGCGWGAMLIHAAKHYGVIGHGVSLSEAADRARPRTHPRGRPRGPHHHRGQIHMPNSRAASTRSPRSACSSISASPTTRPISRRSTVC